MRGVRTPPSSICARCLRARRSTYHGFSASKTRSFASDSRSPPRSPTDENTVDEQEKEQGAMSRRLSAMSEDAIETGGSGAAKAVSEAGFSEDLKKQLEEKLAQSSFRSEHAQAFAQANLPASAGEGTRDIASARPWTGAESTEDATLRMLTDAHKPMRVAPTIPGVRGPPGKVDTGRPGKRSESGTGTRLANARDRTSMYAFTKDAGLSEQEREKLRAELKARFQPAARTAPATVQGLSSLANKRIEDAIARGQFKNLPRGQKIERDHNASSPFIDTTEYLMNKIIQKQEIVPPWIEKQQELVSTASRFRSRLRADWKRHVARVIASRGGDLQKQIQLADEYAYAESVENPFKKREEKLNAVDDGGHVSQITLAGQMKTPSPPTSDPQSEEEQLETELQIMEQTFNDDGTLKSSTPDSRITITTTTPTSTPSSSSRSTPPAVPPFRDAAWEHTERGYHNAAIQNLNTLTRSYNLMAPQLARKPYFNLERELRACFADVAPQVGAAIKQRAIAPTRIRGVEVEGKTSGGVLERLGVGGPQVKLYEEKRPQYGFREFWRDLFASRGKG